MITAREFAKINIRGYKWHYELTEHDFGAWIGKAFLGGMLRHKTKMHSTKEASISELNFDVINNPYFK